jgi:hypothetical protein
MYGIRWACMLEDNPLTILDRVKAGANQLLLQSMLASISYRVWQYDNREDLLLDRNSTEIGAQTAITISTSVFDILQLDDYWVDADGNPIDAIGYNFRFTVPPARFPAASKWYRVEFTFTPPLGGDPFKLVWGVSTTAVASS